MIRALLIALLALASSTHPRHVRLHGAVGVYQTDLPTCGAAQRLLHDQYSVATDGVTAKVNGTDWRVEAFSENSMVLSHQVSPDALTHMILLVDGHDGIIELFSITPATREACADKVRLVVVGGRPSP